MTFDPVPYMYSTCHPGLWNFKVQTLNTPHEHKLQNMPFTYMAPDLPCELKLDLGEHAAEFPQPSPHEQPQPAPNQARKDKGSSAVAHMLEKS